MASFRNRFALLATTVAVVAALGSSFDAALWDDNVQKMLEISEELIEAGADVLVLDTKVYLATALRWLNAPLLPLDHGRAAQSLIAHPA